MEEEEEGHEDNLFSPRIQLIFRHRVEEEFYDRVSDVVAFEKVNVVQRINTIEQNQVYNLRFFLQIFSLSEREFQNRRSKRFKTPSEEYE